MAVDSASKRFSLLDFGRPGYPMVLVPDGTVGELDRADLLGLYAGYELGNPATLLVDAMLMDQDVGYLLFDSDTGYTLVEVDSTTRHVIKRVN